MWDLVFLFSTKCAILVVAQQVGISMKKKQFSKNLFLKITLFSIVAFLLLFLSGNEWFIYVDSAPREAGIEEVLVDDLADEGEADADYYEELVEAVEVDEVYVPRPERVAFLTFDDGPSRYTLDFLVVLAEFEVPATFFKIGQHIEHMSGSRELLNQVLAAGHYIGLHSMRHDMATLYQEPESAAYFVNEMLENQALVYYLTGHHTSLCRPPFGSMGNFTEDHYLTVELANINCINWNVDPSDWQNRDPQVVYQSIRDRVYRLNFPGELMIVLHETSWTLEVLPDIITFLLEHDYVFKIYTPGFEFRYTYYR